MGSAKEKTEKEMNNPLHTPGAIFYVDMMNPNPTARQTKDGPVYRVSFEIHKDAWDLFMESNTKGMVLEMQGRVAEVHTQNGDKCTQDGDTPPSSANLVKGGPISKNAGMFCQDKDANAWAESNGYKDMRAMIYGICELSSRAELDHDEAAAEKYKKIKSDFYRRYQG